MKYQCYYNETIFVENANGYPRRYVGQRINTECFDNEHDAEQYCLTHVGYQANGDVENEMRYEEVE